MSMQGLTRTTLAALVVAVLLVLVGLTFVGQGLGILTGRSIMVGDRTWAVIGAVVVVIGAWLGWRTWTRRAS
jgi:ABC-type nickel/cobalt efflux system permease component RcnA